MPRARVPSTSRRAFWGAALAVTATLSTPAAAAVTAPEIPDSCAAVSPAPAGSAEGAQAERALRNYARLVRAPGAPIESRCSRCPRDAAAPCAEHPLASFFRALDATRAGGRANVLVLGNSLIASDGIVKVVRQSLVDRYGDGGQGLLLADRMAEYGPRDRTARAAAGWLVSTCADGSPQGIRPLGVAGVVHESLQGGARSSFLLRGEERASILWWDHASAPPLSWRFDDGPWTTLVPAADGAQRIDTLEVPGAAKRLELRTPAAGAVVSGVALQKTAGGVTVDTAGVPSADASLFLRTDETAFQQQLAHRDPALVVTILGGNETKRVAWGRAAPDVVEADLRSLLRRVRQKPGTSCLVVGPIDAVVGGDSGDPFRQRPQLQGVIDIQRRVALDEGCAFFDLFTAMGGTGSLRRLRDHNGLHDDLVHPRGRGLDVLGQLLVDALLLEHAVHKQPAPSSSSPARAPASVLP